MASVFLGYDFLMHYNEFMSKLYRPVLVLSIILTAFFASCDMSYHRDYDYQEVVREFEPSCSFENDGSAIVVSPNSETDIGFVFYPGAQVSYDSYMPLMAEIASRGIKCFLVQMPADFAFFDLNASKKFLAKNPDIKHWYLGGHSLGGAMAGFYIAENSEDYEGLILLASFSTSDLKKSGLKVCSIYGSEDGVLNKDSYKKNKKNLPKDLKELVIEGGNHAQFGNYGKQKGDKNAKIKAKDQQVITAEFIADFCKN